MDGPWGSGTVVLAGVDGTGLPPDAHAHRVENGHLHPVLSSMFRVTDGVRMAMHQMLFSPIYEPTLRRMRP